MAATVRTVDRGARRLVREIGKGTVSIRVGVLGGDGEKEYEKGDVTVALVAMWHEFGLGNYPARSWLRGWVDENEKEIQARVSAELRGVLEGKRTIRQAADRVGVWAVASIQKRIADGIPPALAQSTIDRKGSSVPLIDTGQLRSSISYQIEGDA